MVSPSALTFRLRGCPAAVSEATIGDRLSQAFGDVSPNDIHIHSLAAAPWEKPSTKTATLTFTKLPSIIKSGAEKKEWKITGHEPNSSLILDSHFLGLTPLNDVNDQEHDFNCVVLSGLASHPFGSWRPKNDATSWSWIRDALPRALPTTRVIIFGYDTTLCKSNSFQTIADLASSLTGSLKGLGFESPAAKPVIFLAHSLGGVVFKQALTAWASGDDSERRMLRRVVGAVLFGVPSRGMETKALMTVVRGQANEGLVRDLMVKSDYLQSLDDGFFDVALRGRMKLFLAFETKTSPTLAEQADGSFDRTGPQEIIVTPKSATRGLHGTNSSSIFAINENHSDMVKFSEGDPNYHIVLGKLKEICAGWEAEDTIGGRRGLPIVPSASSTESAYLGPEDGSGRVASHPDFESWLSQFAGPPAAQAQPGSQSTELDKGTHSDLPVGNNQSEQASLAARLATPAIASSNTPAYSPTDGSLWWSPSVATQTPQGADEWLSIPVAADDTPITLHISGLEKESPFFSSSKVFSIKVWLGLRTRVDELILALMAKGFRHIEGFCCKESGIGRGPMIPIDEPIAVQVVSSQSQYDVCRGPPLLLNQNEPFGGFYRAVIACRPIHISLLPKRAKSHSSRELSSERISVECAGVRVGISLKRTLRVPDDGRVHNLPAEFGPFPLFNATQLSKSLPEAMKLKGGVLLPMYQREAMFMEFSFNRRGPHCRRLALRVLMGGVNALSGEAKTKGSHKADGTQDYIIVPGQKWLDGFRVDKDTVRQFVAMPVGLGYSVEKQITGEEFIGGIQLEILQERLPELALDDIHLIPRISWSDGKACSLEPEGGTTPVGIGLKPGDLFDLPSKILDTIKFYFPEYRSNWKALPDCIYSPSEGKRASLIQDLVPLTGHRQGGLHLEAIHDPVSIYFESTTTGPADVGGAPARPLIFTSRASLWSPFTLATDLYKNLLRSTGFSPSSNRMKISYNGVQLYPEWTNAASGPRFVQRNTNIFELGIKDSSIISLAYPSENRDRGIVSGSALDALLDPPLSYTPGALGPPQPQRKTWEMAVAAGALIKQDIFRDPDQPPYSGWEANTSGMLNIQILNSVAFSALTGLRTPQTPISAHTYAQNGIPFYTLYEEAPLRDPGAPIWQTIQSVTKIDRARAEDGTLRVAPHVSPSTAAAGCTACVLLRAAVANLADRIVCPCNHAVCGTCWCALNGAAAAAGPGTSVDPSVSGRQMCPVCRKSATGTLAFSAPMGLWESEKHLGCALQHVQLVVLAKTAEAAQERNVARHFA